MDDSGTDHGHIPVLLRETLALLAPRLGETVVDLTVGRGGHAEALARAVGPSGLVMGFDLDPENLAYAARRLEPTGVPFIPVRDNFVRVADHLRRVGQRADLVLADLGFSSNQIDDPERGFSFSADGPLDMRFDPSGPVTAADLLAALPESELAATIAEYGEEPLARPIAQKLVQNRREEPIRTTARLARLVREAYGRRARASRLHPATRTFMALRIAVNDELGALRALMDELVDASERADREEWLNPAARIAVISFHSLEDRVVKQVFADLAKRHLATRLTKRPVTVTEQEAQENPRSRSAKLRAARIGGPDNSR